MNQLLPYSLWMRILMPKVSGLSLRSTPPECYAATPNSRYLSSKKKWDFRKAQGSFHVFQFSVYVLTIPWLQDSTSPFSCQFDWVAIFQQYVGRFRLQHSSSDHKGSFSATASYSKIMHYQLDFCSQFVGDHTRTSGDLKADFLSTCCFFVYILSAIQIAPIKNR